jgi:4-hydroxy-tetrahydrodipicolinate synthase
MRLSTNANGIFPIAPTPFLDNGEVDFESLERLVDFYIACGCHGITVLGQLGEAAKLEFSESLDVARCVVKRASKLPVIVGVSAPGFASMRALAGEVMSYGAAGVMIAPPNTLRTDDQIVGYYHQAVEAIGDDVPFVLQDYPLTFSVQMAPSTIRRIVNDLISCVMIKHEDWPGLDKLEMLRRLQTQGDMRRVSILCGNNGLFFDNELERGADGANTGYCFPDMLCTMFDLFRAGQNEEVKNLFDVHLPLLRYEQQPGIGLAVRKYVLMRRGFPRSAAMRHPGHTLSNQSVSEIETLLRRVAVHDPRARAI